jgi:alpha-tubulin suppressor-like RCC1 family protein
MIGIDQDWWALATSGNFSCAIKQDNLIDQPLNQLYCWGDNSDGQLGDSTFGVSKAQPTAVAGVHTNWVGVSTGSFHACGVKSDNTIYCWGSQLNGLLGNGVDSLADLREPNKIDGVDWIEVAAGSGHTCAMKANNTLWCWGDNSYGQLGNGALWSGNPVEIQFY